MSVAPRLTARQAQVLDALRHGGTVDDVPGCRRHHMVDKLVAMGMLLSECDGERYRYTLTPTGKAAWLESLK